MESANSSGSSGLGSEAAINIPKATEVDTSVGKKRRRNEEESDAEDDVGSFQVSSKDSLGRIF
jgi:hypothetical protein